MPRGHAGPGDGAPGVAPASEQGAPVEALNEVPLFAELRPEDVEQVASLFKERRFAEGETVIKEGSGGAAFFLIESGEATVSVDGSRAPELEAGDHFGEIALIDGGARSATVTAATDLVCYGLTYWDFRPLVQENGDRLGAAAVAGEDAPRRAGCEDRRSAGQRARRAHKCPTVASSSERLREEAGRTGRSSLNKNGR